MLIAVGAVGFAAWYLMRSRMPKTENTLPSQSEVLTPVIASRSVGHLQAEYANTPRTGSTPVFKLAPFSGEVVAL